MKTLILIDAHALIHRSFHALPPLTSPRGEPVAAVYGLSSVLLKILREEKPDFVAAAFDRPEPTFRKEVFKEYKAHRPPAPDELVSQIKKSYEVFENFGILVFEKAGYEADDIIATAAEAAKKIPDLRCVIVTGDLDTLQLVDDEKVFVKTLKKGIGETILYGEKAVIDRYGVRPDKLPDFKALVGDPSDNIPGVSGVGPKTAAQFFREFGSLEEFYALVPDEAALVGKSRPLFEKLLKNKEQILLSKKLTTVCRDVPINFSLPKLSFSGISEERLTPFFKELGFRSLIERLNKNKLSGAPRVSTSRASGNGSPDAADVLFLTNPEEAAARPAEKFSSPPILKTAFDVKPILKILKEKGLTLAPFFDVRIALWLLDPEWKDYSLEALEKKFLRRTFEKPEGILPTLFAFASAKLKEEDLEKIFKEIEMPLVEVLAEMERFGVKIDQPLLIELKKELEEEIAGLEEKIYEACGERFNINSPKQLSEILFQKLKIRPVKRTGAGWPSTDAESLSAAKERHSAIPLILEHREAFKLLSTYVDPVLKLVSADGRLRTTFIQVGTATGRLSSQNPNLQNVPHEFRAKKLRRAFVAEESFKLASFDYSQIELRILAAVADSRKMKEVFFKDGDIHRMTASLVFDAAPSEVTLTMRRLAKTLNFGVVYGMGAAAFSKTSGLSRERAKEFIEEYFRDFPEIKVWQERTVAKARETGYVETLSGRKRYLGNIADFNAGRRAEAERAAVNMPIQGLAADIIKKAMIKIAAGLKEKNWWGEKIRMLLSIHDELLFEIKDDILEEAVVFIKEQMERIDDLGVPLKVEVSSGTNWEELKNPSK